MRSYISNARARAVAFLALRCLPRTVGENPCIFLAKS